MKKHIFSILLALACYLSASAQRSGISWDQYYITGSLTIGRFDASSWADTSLDLSVGKDTATHGTRLSWVLDTGTVAFPRIFGMEVWQYSDTAKYLWVGDKWKLVAKGDDNIFVGSVVQIRNTSRFYNCYICNESGKEGIFFPDKTDVTSPDDTGLVLVNLASLRIKRVTNGFINPTWYGADPGGTIESARALQRAFTKGASLKLPVKITAGTYLVKPDTLNTAFGLKSNTIIFGEGNPRLKVVNNAGNYKSLFTQSDNSLLSNVSIRGITFDQNADSNATAYIEANVLSSSQVAVFFVNAKYIEIADNVFSPCTGVNTVSVNGVNCENITVRNNRFDFRRAGANLNYDNSAVYMNNKNHIVTGNYFRADPDANAGGAIESHNGQSVIANNIAEGYRTGCNVVTKIANDTTYNSDITVTGNTFSKVNNGVRLWAQTGSTVRNVTISGNTIYVAQLLHNSVNCSGILTVNTAGGALDGNYENINITGNTILFQPGDNRTVDKNGTALAYSSIYGIGLQCTGVIKNVSVSSNIVTNSPVRGINLGFTNTMLSMIAIKDNVITNAGFNTNAGGSRASIFVSGNIYNTSIENNVINDTGTATAVGVRSLYYRPADAANNTYVNNRVNAASNNLVEDIDATKPLDREFYSYLSRDKSVNFERIRGYWSAFNFASTTYGFVTDNGGTGVRRAIYIGSGVPGSGSSYTGTRIQSTALPYWQTTSLSMTNNGVHYGFSGAISGAVNAPKVLGISATVNEFGTAGFTMLDINPSITNLGSGSKLLQRWASNDTAKAAIDIYGNLTVNKVNVADTLNPGNIVSSYRFNTEMTRINTELASLRSAFADTTVAADYTLKNGYTTFNGTAATTFTLEAAAAHKGETCKISNIGAGTLTIVTTGGIAEIWDSTVPGAVDTKTVPAGSMDFHSNGTYWIIR